MRFTTKPAILKKNRIYLENQIDQIARWACVHRAIFILSIPGFHSMNSNMKAICTFVLILLTFVTTTVEGQDVVKGNLLPRNAPYDQPLKGWAPYTNAGTIHQPYSMVFLYKSFKLFLNISPLYFIFKSQNIQSITIFNR